MSFRLDYCNERNFSDKVQLTNVSNYMCFMRTLYAESAGLLVLLKRGLAHVK